METVTATNAFINELTDRPTVEVPDRLPSDVPCERRREPRSLLQVAIVCTRLTEAGKPTGGSFRGTTLNISSSGLVFTTRAKVLAGSISLLNIEFRNETGKVFSRTFKVLRHAEHDGRQAIAGMFVELE